MGHRGPQRVKEAAAEWTASLGSRTRKQDQEADRQRDGELMSTDHLSSVPSSPVAFHSSCRRSKPPQTDARHAWSTPALHTPGGGVQSQAPLEVGRISQAGTESCRPRGEGQDRLQTKGQMTGPGLVWSKLA